MRRRDREITDRKKIIEMIDACEIVHIGLADGDYPYIVPMNFGYSVEGDVIKLYIHGAMAGRKYELLKKNPRCSFEMDRPLGIDCLYDSMDVTMRYQSVMGKATVEFLEGDEKRRALDETLMARNPQTKGFAYNPAVLTRTAVACLTVTEISAKENPMKRGNIYEVELGDITKSKCECIVNAANKSLLGGGGVDGAIHRAAGRELLDECRTLHGCQVGEAKITKGYQLEANYVIHTVGPIYSGSEQDKVDLANCYYNSLNLAKENGIHSIAFPAISTGVYGYPLEEATPIALAAVEKWFSENGNYGMKVVFTCFSQRTFDSYR